MTKQTALRHKAKEMAQRIYELQGELIQDYINDSWSTPEQRQWIKDARAERERELADNLAEINEL